MKAAVVREFGRPLVLEDRADPEPGTGQVLVRVEASGLCHTDIHAAHGDWPVKPHPPFVPGHEGVGVVERLGAGVTHLDVGDRVAVPWLGWACGRCAHCLSGWETLCHAQKNTGYGVDGGWAGSMLAWADFAARVPDGVDPREAAPLTCAGVTTYKALKVADIGPTDLVAISGVGGLGHLAVQYAKIAGATVAAIDITDEKLALASDLGADIVIDARSDDPAKVLQSHGGASAAIGLAVDNASFATAYAGLRRGGRLVLVALPAAGSIEIPVFDTVLNGTSVIGSIVGTRADLDEVFALHAAGRTRVIYETRPLAAVNDSIREVLQGTVKARIVFTP
ncbi:zinc-dependent alcohol dehydrogenase [Phytoactinopolyspora halotolerans]|uniref:Alcohol dehydrogenase n=1 Tax=Phytoactinopolyspora halotolerans TaxID=1981512 RepID=A0A6L9S7N5_9ACTN|nr:zinc-dependent alcohol dehydrogenase [Phytoactinopolyspora halotolerans]NEE00582.1 zinc-dependent alcohol dehydrogenase [Phytoactinopolyspora halotolerans]